MEEMLLLPKKKKKNGGEKNVCCIDIDLNIHMKLANGNICAFSTFRGQLVSSLLVPYQSRSVVVSAK